MPDADVVNKKLSCACPGLFVHFEIKGAARTRPILSIERNGTEATWLPIKGCLIFFIIFLFFFTKRNKQKNFFLINMKMK